MEIIFLHEIIMIEWVYSYETSEHAGWISWILDSRAFFGVGGGVADKYIPLLH